MVENFLKLLALEVGKKRSSSDPRGHFRWVRLFSESRSYPKLFLYNYFTFYVFVMVSGNYFLFGDGKLVEGK